MSLSQKVVCECLKLPAGTGRWYSFVAQVSVSARSTLPTSTPSHPLPPPQPRLSHHSLSHLFCHFSPNFSLSPAFLICFPLLLFSSTSPSFCVLLSDKHTHTDFDVTLSYIMKVMQVRLCTVDVCTLLLSTFWNAQFL